ncbi:MAG: hypothetical protein WC796_05495 [Candidatus Pacearchaeota archaeon]|jgi:hypothetical protein
MKLAKIKNNKQGVSELVAYVILIVIAISISLLVYAYLKIILPKSQLECDDGVSVELKDYNCIPTDKVINMTIKNNGLFGVQGLNIRYADKPNSVTSRSFRGVGPDGRPIGENGTFYFLATMQQGVDYNVNLSYASGGKISKLQITPVQFKQDADGKRKEFVLCKNSILTRDIVGCGY